MSESIQKAAGSQFRKILGNITKNKWFGFLTGLILTSIIQSSSATTVMTVSFVNAGLMSALESVGLILGANVGTTITGWLVSLFGIKINLSEYAVILFAIGVPLFFVKQTRLKYWGDFIVGFSMIFMGLGLLRSAVPLFDEDALLFDWIRDFTQHGIFSRMFFVLIGIVITILVQSSSVAMAVTLTMSAQGWLPVEVAASLILGENIGTTSTVLFASMLGNKEAKICARIHFFFNVIGVLVMVVILPSFLPILSSSLSFVFGTDDIYKNPLDMTIGLSAFHTAFNLLNALVLINFDGWLTSLAALGLKNKKVVKETEIYHKFLENTGYMPEIAAIQIQKEVHRFGETITDMAGYFRQMVDTVDTKKQQKLFKNIKQYEKRTDLLEIEINQYINKLSKEDISTQAIFLLRTILKVCSHLEIIADKYQDLSILIQKKSENNVYFLPDQRANIKMLLSEIESAIKVMNENLSMLDYKKVNKSLAKLKNETIKQTKAQFLLDAESEYSSPNINIKSTLIYNNVLMILSEINDQILDVTIAANGDV